MSHIRENLQTAGQREIDPSLVKKISDEPIGSGTFGNVFLAEYCGMKVTVKEMKGKDGSRKETERCRQEVLQGQYFNESWGSPKPAISFWDVHKTSAILDCSTISWYEK